MLKLDSPRWSEIAHAYGIASDVPELLARASSGDAAAVEELYGAICHQESVYSASFAAVPHLVEIAGRTDRPDLKAHVLILIGSIALSSDDRSDPHLAPEIKADYAAVLPQALSLALATLAEDLEPHVAVYLLQVAAGLKGFVTISHALSGFIEEEFTLDCPECGSELYIWPSPGGLSIAAEDPVQSPNTPCTAVVPGPRPGMPSEDQYRWLLRVAGESALSVIESRLSYLFGSGECPACGRDFSLVDEF